MGKPAFIKKNGEADLTPVSYKPFAISRQNVGQLFIGLSPKTLANKASKGEGPPVFKVGSTSFYLVADLKRYIKGEFK